MSLNWREIDLVLRELDLEGAHVRQVHQPGPDSLVFELHKGASFRLLVSLSNPHCRIHRLSRPIANPLRPPRFASFLRAHIRGGRILEARQIGDQRIIRLAIARTGSQTILWIRL